MPECIDDRRQSRFFFPPSAAISILCFGALLPAVSSLAQTQSPAPSSTAPAQSETTSPQAGVANPPPSSDTTPGSPALVAAPAGAFTLQPSHGELKEEELKQLLIGKSLYIRGGYQDNNLDFDEHGKLVGHSPRGSYTLSQIQINKIKLSKRKLELQGDRYALHFLGAAPFEDPTAATDRVKITPRKKVVRVWIEREEVEKPKKEKNKDEESRKHHDKNKGSDHVGAQPALETRSAGPAPNSLEAPSKKHDSGDTRKAASETQSTQQLLTALDAVFARGIDDRMIATMPDFWKLYYQAVEAKTAFKPADPGVFRQNDVDQKAKLISALDPPSNELAQKNGIAGIALYHAIVGSDGKVNEIVAGRPIGFGLDENAEQSIRNAVFQPAMKEGKAVPVMLDLVVSFRIYSKRTSQPAAAQDAADKTAQPVLPGPYTLQDLKAQAAAQPQTQTAAPPQQSQP